MTKHSSKKVTKNGSDDGKSSNKIKKHSHKSQKVDSNGLAQETRKERKLRDVPSLNEYYDQQVNLYGNI